MTVIEPILIEYIRTKTPITDIIGTDPMRLFPLTIPIASADPSVAYQKISTQHNPRMNDGKSSLAYSRMQFSIRSQHALTAATLGDVLRAQLQGSVIRDDNNVTLAKIGAPLNDFGDWDSKSDTHWYYIDFPVWYNE